jgi:hypothetical protein
MQAVLDVLAGQPQTQHPWCPALALQPVLQVGCHQSTGASVAGCTCWNKQGRCLVIRLLPHKVSYPILPYPTH